MEATTVIPMGMRVHNPSPLIRPLNPLPTLQVPPEVMEVNPTVETPMRVQDLIGTADLSFLEGELESLYKDGWKDRLPPIAMLKATLYWRLSGKPHLKKVWHEMVSDPELADTLGFRGVPEYSALFHFVNYRLTPEAIHGLTDALLAEVLGAAAAQGIEIGREIMPDSTPLAAKPKDKEATYSGHYKLKGYKWHNLRCADTGIPLDWHLTVITDYDGDFFVPLMSRFSTMTGITPKVAYVDGHYVEDGNLVHIKETWGTEIIGKVPKNWVYRDEITRKDIIAAYRKLWKNDDYEIEATFDQMKKYLMRHGADQPLRDFYHNQMMKERDKDPKAYKKKYHKRNRIEGHHGQEKNNSGLKLINGKGLKKYRIHLGLHVAAMLVLTLYRLRRGVTEGLTNLGGLV